VGGITILKLHSNTVHHLRKHFSATLYMYISSESTCFSTP